MLVRDVDAVVEPVPDGDGDALGVGVAVTEELREAVPEAERDGVIDGDPDNVGD